ncbi:formamidopyrimidine-DNA glycosylase [Bryocella elongata]|uniref:Formamidopyrimidine-DNA glycosylase n=1 Tax=Bryocella elongata TaxID=863522 RepID=A0A1H5WZV6_9BACT|nr:DNA-formamidopyrimidine glycosylase family protein [Bryocella elongata]SEG04988.1 formamidopyrimidine-DNA glycosylase [Bryocella elongata]
MPELPDITAYLTALAPRVIDQPLEFIRIASPFLLRTVDPPLAAFEGKPVKALRRIGKRIVFEFEDDPHSGPSALTPAPLFLVLHLMIAGRLHWHDLTPKKPRPKVATKGNLAAFDFPNGTLTLTEAGSKRRASLYAVRGEAALHDLDPGGLDIFALTLEELRAALTQENRTLKRALTDPRVLSGIGNAYSDEILWAAQLSPLLQTRKLTDAQWQSLYNATRETLTVWIERFNTEAAKSFPEKVTAFRPDMAVHGRHNLPCPRCGSPVQRIRYADNETNYCATCQTEGKVLADRSLSRLLGSDWPRTLDELEALRRK